MQLTCPSCHSCPFHLTQLASQKQEPVHVGANCVLELGYLAGFRSMDSCVHTGVWGTYPILLPGQCTCLSRLRNLHLLSFGGSRQAFPIPSFVAHELSNLGHLTARPDNKKTKMQIWEHFGVPRSLSSGANTVPRHSHLFANMRSISAMPSVRLKHIPDSLQ